MHAHMRGNTIMKNPLLATAIVLASCATMPTGLASAEETKPKPRHTRSELGPHRFMTYSMVVDMAGYEKFKTDYFQGLLKGSIQCADGDLVVDTAGPNVVVKTEAGRSLISSHVELGGQDLTLAKVEGVFTTLRDLMGREVVVIKITASDPAKARWAYAVPCSN
jgi:hypothetical protein